LGTLPPQLTQARLAAAVVVQQFHKLRAQTAQVVVEIPMPQVIVLAAVVDSVILLVVQVVVI
jgi:hypothetical protein